MRRLFLAFILLFPLLLRAVEPAENNRILKTVPLLLNAQGQAALSPSLFDRDAYQAYLLQHTNEISAIRYDVLWRVKSPGDGHWKLRLELRSVAPDGAPLVHTLETNLNTPSLRHWDSLTLSGADYRKCAQIVAWRTTLWHDDVNVSEQKSFLW